jgi:DNA-binding NarL/FixJ family response regulator
MNARNGGEAGTLRVVLADGRPWVRSALKLLVEQDGVMKVSAEVAKAEELVKQLSISCPDAILLDCDLPGLRVSEFLPQLHSLCPLVRVVAMCSRPEVQQAALSAGADAFVCKTEPPERLLAVLRDCLEALGASKPMAWSDCQVKNR